MAIIRAKGVSKFYTIGARKIQVLSNINLNIKEGEFVAIQGDNYE